MIRNQQDPFTRRFSGITSKDLASVGGKNSSLGEMFSILSQKGINVPDGFATTSHAYWKFLEFNNLSEKLTGILNDLDIVSFNNLPAIGKQCRELILKGTIPEEIIQAILNSYKELKQDHPSVPSLAVRSSATAEDLPTASFAGQQETYLNVKGEKQLLNAIRHCYASLFTDRAIKYRVDNGFEHMKVALSAGVQLMVRADKGCSGVIFTIDPDSGFENAILLSGSWGLGENVVQGAVNTDEFLVYKPFLGKVKNPIISRKLGTKLKTMIYSNDSDSSLLTPEEAVTNIETSVELQEKFILNDEEILKLSEWAIMIEKHFSRPMDIEFAKDGISGDLYILQARPETVFSQKSNSSFYQEYRLKNKSKILSKGIALGNRIVSGVAKVLTSVKDIDKLNENEILVTERTDPDWDPILKKAAAIVTDQGGRTSHAAIVARELGAVAIVGTSDATKNIKSGQVITVSAAEGETGFVYDGQLEWESKSIDTSGLIMPETKPMLILAHPEQAFKYSFLPNEGVGLMRMEFIINSSIGIHPMALRHFDELKDKGARDKIQQLTNSYANKSDYFTNRLAEATALIAAAFYPKDVIVRMSDFKTNEYAHLLGGKEFEPQEENPMIGFRGASRYYHPLYKDGFELECRAMKKVREEMGFRNVKLMIPFCRTVDEASRVLELMQEFGLRRNVEGLEIYMMVEIPSNAILLDEFSDHFDGFSIGSNDLTQLTLGADRDSTLLEDVFDPFDPAVMKLISMSITKAKKGGKKIGLCGQAPSDFPEYASFLVDSGIDSISFNPDALLKGINNIKEAEHKLK